MKQKHKDNNTNTKDNNTDVVDVRQQKFWKFWLLLCLLLVGMGIVVVRLAYIQIIKGSEYTELAKRQQQTKQELLPQRGNIYDRNGNLLASTIKSIGIAVDPTVLKHKDSLATLIENHIGINRRTILDKINSAKGQYVRLCSRVTADKVNEIRKLKAIDRGIILIDEPTRYYNYSSIAAQLIGTASLDNKGQSGLELYYDAELSGQSGFMVMYRDALQRLRPALDLPTLQPVDGTNLYLTIDIELQKILEFELMQGVVNSIAKSATAIAIDPHTGEVLAMASYPGYNPNLRGSFSAENMRIRAITDAFEPGSTFKTITGAIAIDDKITKTTDLYNGYGGLYAQSTFKIKDEHSLGIVPLSVAFELSSNIIFSQVAMKIPDKDFYKYVRDFGFGLKTGIDIPGEVSGRVPKFDRINSVDKRYLGFGYGIMSTPIQLATAYSAIANGGKLLKPYIVSKIEKDGEVIREQKPQVIRTILSEQTTATMKRLLLGVVNKGTGSNAFVESLGIAGKTGTAQMLVSGTYSKNNHLASFVGFYPATNPKICLLIYVDDPTYNFYGGSVAAPIFKNIALRWTSVSPNFLNSNVNPTLDIVYVPDLRGVVVDDATTILKEMGLSVNTDNSNGVVVSQHPSAGSRVKKNTNVILKVDLPSFENVNNETTANTFTSKLPNVTGLSMRRAISILHNAGIRANVRGSGVVKSQKWENKGEKGSVCVLVCE
ncbi:MAG: PASTA domain-containing protein [Ignavibacteria bacterium]|jgi:cell division protein FtsI/penicillin-binding protein 2|nr:PASTA domain-containing protein [Ignavibacteria bacterium]